MEGEREYVVPKWFSGNQLLRYKASISETNFNKKTYPKESTNIVIRS